MRLRNVLMECTVQEPLQQPTNNGQYYRLRAYDYNKKGDKYSYINVTILVHSSETNLLDFLATLNPKDRIVVNAHLLDVNTFVGRDQNARASLMLLASGTNSVSVARRAQPEVVEEGDAQVVEELVAEAEDDGDPFAQPL